MINTHEFRTVVPTCVSGQARVRSLTTVVHNNDPEWVVCLGPDTPQGVHQAIVGAIANTDQYRDIVWSHQLVSQYCSAQPGTPQPPQGEST